MLKLCMTLLSVALLGLSTLSAAETLAVAEPVNKGGLSAAEIEGLWSLLETNVDGGYELVSRAALKTMLTETGLAQSSGLVDPESKKAELGKLKGVKYLLIPTVSKFGSRLNFSMMVIDCSTGAIDPEKRASVTVSNLDMLADRLESMLAKMHLNRPAAKNGRVALLYPIVEVPIVPLFLFDDFNAQFQNQLLKSGIKLVGTQKLGKILKDNNLAKLDEAERAQFVRLATLLEADYLILPIINRYGIQEKRVTIAVTKRTVVRRIGNFEGSIGIRSAKTGDILASVPFEKKIDFDDLSEDTDDWTPADYYKYMIKKTIPSVAAEVADTFKKTVAPGN